MIYGPKESEGVHSRGPKCEAGEGGDCGLLEKLCMFPLGGFVNAQVAGQPEAWPEGTGKAR